MKSQATKLNPAQLQHEIERQRNGLPCEFAHRRPVLDALLGAAVITIAIGGMVGYWIAKGAGL